MAHQSILDSARRILLGPLPWLLESYEMSPGMVSLRGWALSGHEAPSDFTFLVNGRRPDAQQLGLTSPDLERVFPFFPSSARNRFRVDVPVGPEDTELRISYCDAYTRRPIYRWHDTYVPLSEDRFPVPGAEQLQRTQGNTSAERFRAYGYTTYRRILELARVYFRRNGGDLQSVLDWGCGCGRVTRHFAAGAGIQVHGCDIDADNVGWCQRSISGASFSVAGLMPPTGYGDSAFDLVVGISVLTHLTGDAEQAWSGEIARVLKPGGIALMTVHGHSGLARILDDERLSQALASGRSDSVRDRRLDRVLDNHEYYRATFHTHSGAAAIFAGKLELVDIVPAANALVQDFLVLQKER